MFSANSRTDHFSDSKVILRLSIPDKLTGFETEQTIDRAENILSTNRSALQGNMEQPHPTYIMRSAASVSKQDLKTGDYHKLSPIKKTQSNTDNKTGRHVEGRNN